VTIEDTVVSDRTRKVLKFRDGRLFASSGDAEGGEELRRAVSKRLPMPRVGSVSALLVMPDGKAFTYEGATWVREAEPYVAIGSGAAYALAAMDFGASAVEAVKGACKRHTRSGGRVFVVKLNNDHAA
jgi:hypothetical protein